MTPPELLDPVERIDESRRRVLERAFFGAGLIGLRALATGLPAALFAHPKSARAQVAAIPDPSKAQYVVLASSSNGDPVNANAPGMFDYPAITHSPDPLMAPTAMTLGGRTVTAALPWTTLPSWVLDRTCFFHHGTYTVVHSENERVLGLGDALAQHELLPSMLAAELAPALGTIQSEPLTFGPTLRVDGRPQPRLLPSALGTVLGTPTGALGRLRRLRDADLDRLNALYKAEGNKAQREFLDRYARSWQQARNLSESLLTQLQAIKDNSTASAITASVTLIRMNLSPVVALSIPFGGDNHDDAAFAKETTETISGVQHIGNLWTQLRDAGLEDRVSFLSLSVFGRTLTTTNGRDHYGSHQCSIMIGKGLKSSVIGGLEPPGGRTQYQAMSLDSATGNGVVGNRGDVPFLQTLASAGKTFGAAVGVGRTLLDERIAGGKVITGALS